MRSKGLLFISLFFLFLFLPIAHASLSNPRARFGADDGQTITNGVYYFDSTGNYRMNRTNFFGDSSDAQVSPLHIIGNGSIKFQGGATNARHLKSNELYLFPNTRSVSLWVNWTPLLAPVPPPFGQAVTALEGHEGISTAALSNWDFGIRNDHGNASNGTLYAISRREFGTAPMLWEIEDAPGIRQNNWTQIGISQSGSGAPTFYINGVAYPAQNKSGNTSDLSNVPSVLNTTRFYLGGAGIVNGNPTFAGYIDEFAYWEKIISDQDFQSLYNAGVGVAYPYSNLTDANFTVVYNSTQDLAVTTKITMRENSTDFQYKYALSCDIGRTTLWNEVFNNFYNFTIQNVSTSFANPNSYLTFNGIQWDNVVGVTPNFDIVKNANTGYRDFLSLELNYQTGQDNYAEFIAYDSSNNPALYLILNKTGNNLRVRQYFPAFALSNSIANFTLTGGAVALAIQLTPHHDSGTNTDDFLFTIRNANQTGTQASTNYETIPGVENIQDVELFVGNRVNSTTFYQKLSLYKTSDPNPDFRQFQNGERETIMGVTIETPSPEGDMIAGDGFTIVPDFNNIFYSICQYNDVASKTQRHFISRTNEQDSWNNFRDLTITPAQVSTNTSDDTEGGAAGAGSGDFGTDVIPSFFNSIGFTSTASKLLIWLFISIVLAAIGFSIHPVLGILVFVAVMIAGVPIGMVPLWFLILFIILAAGLFAAGLKFIFAR